MKSEHAAADDALDTIQLLDFIWYRRGPTSMVHPDIFRWGKSMSPCVKTLVQSRKFELQFLHYPIDCILLVTKCVSLKVFQTLASSCLTAGVFLPV